MPFARTGRVPFMKIFAGLVVALSVSTQAFAQHAAGGTEHTLILKDDGSVWSVGGNGHGQLGDNSVIGKTIPIQVSGLANVIAVAAGSFHSMALTSGGTVYLWGHNGYGQIGNNGGGNRTTPTLLSLTNIVAIAAGEFHSVALTSTGEVYAWGYNANGQLGNATQTDSLVPIQVATGVHAIAGGARFTLFVKTDGTVDATGINTNGQLGDSTTTQRTSAVPMSGVSTAIAARAGAGHSVILLSDGTVLAVGNNGFAQLGDGSLTSRLTVVPVVGLAAITDIAIGKHHGLALDASGAVWSWGGNAYGQLGNTGPVHQHTATAIAGLSSIAFIGAGADHSIAIDEAGVVSTWGLNYDSQLGEGTTTNRSNAEPISGADFAWRVATPTLSIAAGTYSVDKTVVVSVATSDSIIHYTQTGADPTESDPTVSSGASVVVSASQTLKAKAWKSGMPASVVAAAAYEMKVALPAVSPAAGTYTTAKSVTLSTTTPGSTLRYTLDGSDPTASSPLYTAPVTVDHTATLKAVGFKSAWSNSDVRSALYTMNFGTLAAPTVTPATGTYEGQVSVEMSPAQGGSTIRYTVTGATPTSNSPAYTGAVTVSDTATVKAKTFHPDYLTSAETSRVYTIRATTPTLSVATGAYAPGSVVTIATPESGATLRLTLDGTDPTATSPIVVSGTSMLIGNFTLKVRAFRTTAIDSNVASGAYSLTTALGPGAASAGADHTVMATPDGRVYAFGENGNGQLGEGSFTDRTTPVLLPTLTGVTALSAGFQFTLARTWDGQVFAWGANTSGKLGDGTTTQRTRPVPITTLANIVALATGDSHSLALASDGRVFSWGDNVSGQLGLGSTIDALVPTEITTLSNIVAIAAGDSHSLAISSGGQLYVWGSNGSSRLGDGTTTTRTSPTLIGLTNVVGIAAGAAHSLALQGGGAVYSWGLGSSGQLGHGSTTLMSTPTLVSGMHASAIAAGDNHSAAIRGDGTLLVWGANASGQVGDGSTIQRTSPTVIASLASTSTLTLGDLHSAAVSPGGTLSMWGEGGSGRLGDGGTVDRLSPFSAMTGISAWIPAAPTVNVPSGMLQSAQNVTIASPTAGATIRYTLDGSEPSDVNDEVPANGEVEIAFSSMLRARAFVEGRVSGAIARADYMLQAVAPTISPGTGTYSTAQTVTLSAGGPPSSIRYTLDGTDPTASSTLYSSPLNISTTLTLKARAFPSNGWTPSAVLSATFGFNYGTLSVPVATPDGGPFQQSPTVSLSAMAGAAIRYTLDGSTPTSSSALYVASLIMPTAGGQLKAKAYHPDWLESVVLSETYVTDTTPPVITTEMLPSPVGGWVTTATTVTFHCSDANGVASCSAPAALDVEGAGQVVSGTAIDAAGNSNSANITLNLDLTAPTVSLMTPEHGSTTTDTSVQVTASVGDSLSGIGSVTCNGEPAEAAEGLVNCTVELRRGRNSIAVVVRDGAGNSASVGATISRVGTATQLKLSPPTRTMLIDESSFLSLRDEFGAAIASATWTSSDANVVALLGDDPPYLTATGVGQATITATKDGLSSTATIDVIAGETLAAGTTRWIVTPPSGTEARYPMYARRVDDEGPAIYTSEKVGSETVVHGLTIMGDEMTLEVTSGEPLVADAFGGLIVGLPGYDSWTTGLARIAGSPTIAPWRYESPGGIIEPAVAPSGAIFATEIVPGIGSQGQEVWDRQIVVINGGNGQVIRRIPLPRSVEAFVAALDGQQLGSLHCNSWSNEEGAEVRGPAVFDDGRAVFAVVERRSVGYDGCVPQWGTPYEQYNKLQLITLSATGTATFSTVFEETCSEERQTATSCDGFTGMQQLIPDALGGYLLRWAETSKVGFDYVVTQKFTRISGEGVRADFTDTDNVQIALTSSNGRSILRNGAVRDTATWTPLWSVPASEIPVLSLANGGQVGMIAAELTVRDGDGVVTYTTPWIHSYFSFSSILGGQSALHAVDGFTLALSQIAVPEFDEATATFTGGVNEVPSPLLWEVAALKCSAPTFTTAHRELVPNHEYIYRLLDPNPNDQNLTPQQIQQRTWTDAQKRGVRKAFELWRAANLQSGLNTTFREFTAQDALDGTPQNITMRKLPINPVTINGQLVDVPATSAWDSGIPVNVRQTGSLFTYNTLTSVLFGEAGYRKATLHEIGHTLGLADNDPYKGNGTSVMNHFSKGLPDDMKMHKVATTVRPCDAQKAWEAAQRP